MCNVFFQVLVHIQENSVVNITGDTDGHISPGCLCPKGAVFPELPKHFVGIAPDEGGARQAMWFPEEGMAEYGWKKINVNIF